MCLLTADPKAPTWPQEPLPPGTDATDGSLSITSELASFYSDLAAIESTPDAEAPAPDDTSGRNVGAAPPEGSAIAPSAGHVVVGTDSPAASGDESAGVKKKKRKVKKLQPWRSGNLETWINKWAKAQQELEN